MKNIFKKVIFETSVFFTVITLFFSSVMQAGGSEIYETPVMTSKGIFCILLFSAILACTNMIFETKLSLAAKLAIHFPVTAIDFAVVYFLMGKSSGGSQRNGFMLFVIFFVLYVISAIAVVSAKKIASKISSGKK